MKSSIANPSLKNSGFETTSKSTLAFFLIAFFTFSAVLIGTVLLLTITLYSSIILPSMAAIFLSAFIVLAHLAIKSFDLVIALTGGGPGYATDLPATYMYTMAFSRGNIGQAASSAMVMMAVVFAIVVPYLYSELRAKND